MLIEAFGLRLVLERVRPTRFPWPDDEPIPGELTVAVTGTKRGRAVEMRGGYAPHDCGPPPTSPPPKPSDAAQARPLPPRVIEFEELSENDARPRRKRWT